VPRPKRTSDYSGSIIGAAIGGLLGGPAGAALGGAALGGLVGSAANPQKKMPLRDAIEQLVNSVDLTFVSVEREGRFVIRIVFGDQRGRHFFSMRIRVAPGRRQWTSDALSDAFYDQAVKKLNEWRARIRT
jgi:hypothetical protein